RDSMAELVAAYVEGDAKALETLIARSLEGLEEGEHKELGKRLNRKLLHDRNITMAAAIKSAVEAEPGRTNFFAVGSGHYLGEENIRDILTEDGYTVTHVAE